MRRLFYLNCILMFQREAFFRFKVIILVIHIQAQKIVNASKSDYLEALFLVCQLIVSI